MCEPLKATQYWGRLNGAKHGDDVASADAGLKALPTAARLTSGPTAPKPFDSTSAPVPLATLAGLRCLPAWNIDPLEGEISVEN